MKHVLVTGGLGFIGSNFIEMLLKKYSDYIIVNIDACTYAANSSAIKSELYKENYIFEKVDIRKSEEIEKIFSNYDIKHVIHFAAESHVDNSINNPLIFAETNVIGTINLLEACRKKNSFIDGDSIFYHISTDEVYGTLESEGYFTEQTPYAPNSPYSASKASSDFFVRSYHSTYNMNVITSNCSNNYGPNQHDEKLIPTIIRKAIAQEMIPIYGDGKNVRDWLYVEDHCKAIDLIFHNGVLGETYLIGGSNEKTNLEVAYTICTYLNEILNDSIDYKQLITNVTDRKGHDFRYAIDASKLINNLDWKPDETFETGIKKTIDWYLNKYHKESSNRNEIN
ncbi:dTDP-glucose 4,6-dehydratase [Exiguobacterium sp. s193]|uniref:dTDP-glucose 4,6-dehydratase n=1 Tax=Exiguobacterium sp. s193 TaxID=2751207 RepID=UPI001BE4F010|nr:dTDP-glucose 4,6-dehydratase [Exiguobacterium sp. s193]